MLISCLIGWGVITWPLGWSDPSIGCAWSISSLPCFLYICPDVFNINLFFSLVNFSLRCLDLCWIVPADMSSLQETKTCDLIQPSAIIPLEVCSYVVLGYVTIFLTIVTTFPCIVVPIVMVYMVFPLYMVIWYPHRLWFALKGSTFILVKKNKKILACISSLFPRISGRGITVAMTIKSLCPHNFCPIILC